MRHRTVRRATVAALAALGLATASACTADTADDPAETIATPTNTEGTDGTDTADTRSDEDDGDAAAPGLPASLHTADGAELGTVEFHERDGGVEVRAVLSGMDPGFYGFHIHAVGECEPDSASPDDPEDTGDFMSAGSHLNPTDAQHPDHAGDMPPLLVTESGDAELTFLTDRFTLADLEDEDGSAVIIHSDPDNFAHVPERYAAEGPDEDTTSTGDAGDRLACGVVGA